MVDLINVESQTWKMDELNSLFCLNDIDNILTISLSTTCSRDKIIWHFTKSETYEVKSGYHLARKLSMMRDVKGNIAQSSNHVFSKVFWNFLWAMKIKNKHKHFLRVCKRLNHVNSVYKRCGLEDETVEHMFFKCRDSQITWKMSPINWNDANITNFSLWWKEKINTAKNMSQFC
ncbi:hypothetical protein R3W88_017143 [Solanum pinnatisectum]|uniref:Reverse transcriptase zinc-binding domain-containing protein n=1 Tax=Solanum pinnatisectum TaxID=50273 RepID=A0AAV9L2F0_9SOLN|nr:hypothetical protein R3W88_017143 [Solanum pinnatisectum]